MGRRVWARIAGGAFALALLAGACGGAAAPTPSPTKAPAPAATATPLPAGAPTPTATRPVAAAVSTPTPTAAAPPTTRAATGPVGKMTMAATADITNLDVHVATAGGLQDFYSNADVNATLLSQQAPGPAAPYLAESWSWDEKGLKVRFVIRKGARFHDGKPVTADDVKFTADKVRSPYATRGLNSTQAPWIKDVQVIDERTIVFTAREINAKAYSIFGALATQPRHDPYEVMQRKPIGAGPYRVVEWRPFESLTIEASPHFWQPIAVKTIVRLVVPEPESRLAMLKSGQVDFMDEVQPRQAEELFKDKRFRVKVTDAGTHADIVFSTDTPVIPGTDIPNPFLDARVRRAFIMALDRKAIFEGVALGKYGLYVPGPYSRAALGANTLEDKITPYKYDPQAARKLLEEARFPFDREWGVWYYRTSAGFAESVEVAVAQWNAIGVKARGRLTEVGTLMSYWQEQPSRTYPVQMVRAAISSDGEVAAHIWAPGDTPEGYISQISDKKLGELTTRLRTAFEPAERQQIFEEMYLYLHEQAVTFPLLGGVLIHAFNQRVDWDPIPGLQSVRHLWRAKWMPGAP